MKPICFYHKADLDGVCSGAIVKHFVPDCELYGIDYGEKFDFYAAMCPACKGCGIRCDSERMPCDVCDGGKQNRTVYMVDVSLSPKDMKWLAEVSNLIWVDHHKTAIAAYDSPEGGRTWPPHEILLQTDWSACELCWYWFTGADLNDSNKQIPEAVSLLGRYDVWDKDHPEWESKILPFQYGMRAIEGIYDPADSLWELMFIREDAVLDPWDMDLGSPVIEVGSAILRYQAEVNRRAIETGAHDVLIKAERWFDEDETPAAFSLCRRDLRGERIIVKALACNTMVFNSQFFEGFFDPERHDVMCAYCQLKDGKWKVSLYSTNPEIDCGEICKTFGGGGHKGAAEFVCDKLPWELAS